MRQLLYSIFTILIGCGLTGCKSTPHDITEGELSFNPYVEAFTTGKISRYAPVRLILNQDIPEEKLNTNQLKKQVKIKPVVDGEFSFENNRTILFTPKEALRRDTPYQLTADLSDWFPVSGKEKIFSFRFSTLPFQATARMQALRTNPMNPANYDAVIEIRTADKESDTAIESSVTPSGYAESVTWQHAPDGKKHTMIIENIPSPKTTAEEIEITITKNKYDIPPQKILSISIPTATAFNLYDIRLINDYERYIEVIFNQSLDRKQNVEGMIWLEGGSRQVSENESVQIDDNVVRIYPASARKGTFQVHISKDLRNQKGEKLGETKIHELEISEDKPAVEFIGKGVILPQSTDLIIPFRAVYLRGVVVRVIRIMENNIGQFLQTNTLDGNYELTRVGRLIARKTIILEDGQVNLSEWNTFAVDLHELMEPEPGAIYRIELSFSKDLSAYPCEEEPTKTIEELQAQDIQSFEKEIRRYDNSGYYYYYDYDFDWSDYNYEKREDPCSNSYYYNKIVARNVLASNLGVIAKRGSNNEMLVLVNNILTTHPERGVKVTIHNYQNQLIGEGTTDGAGQTTIRMSAGKPFYIIAAQGEQKSYLRIDDGASLSLSNFDVSGEVVQKGIKGFIYGDRGVWRPGDTLYLSFMLNDRDQTLPENHPVIMELYNPNGQLYLKKTQVKGVLGMYAFEMPTDADVPTGAWNVQVKVGGATFYKRIRIESIKPNRLKINLTHPDNIIVRGESYNSNLHVEWLQGATARNLKYEIEGTFTAIPTTFEKFKGYYFDFPVRQFTTESVEMAKGNTDEKGDADVRFQFGVGESASGMLLASLFTRVYEESGDFSIDGEQLLYSPYIYYAGIKAPEENDSYYLHTDKNYQYEVASVDHKGNAAPGRELKVKVYKTERYWWWSTNYKTLANFLQNSYNRPVHTFDITTNTQGKGSFSLRIPENEWGSYYITVEDSETDHTAGIRAYFDWPGYRGRRNADEDEGSAHTLRLKTDKESYEPGEMIRITIPSSEGSRAIVSIENGSKILAVSDHPCQNGETIVEIPATDDMRPNAYAHVTLLQPHGYSRNDLPIRMYGVVPFLVNSKESHLHPVLTAPEEIRPEESYQITVSEKDGREMGYTIAIVDEGLLDLTRFRTPNPWSAFNAREALGITTWDLYNYIVGAYGGKIEQIFSIGGDDALNAGAKAVVNRFKPVVQFEGPFLLKKGEKKIHQYTMPNYNGRVRMMIIAGDGSAYGNTEKSVMVRKPVMVLGTLPRVIGIEEEMEVPATVFATEDGIGKVKVSISCSDNMQVMGNSTQELTFNRKEDKQATFRIRVKNNPGAGKVTITATGKGEKAVYETDIEIRSVRRPQTKSQLIVLQPGETTKENLSLPGAAGTNSLTLEVADVFPVNLDKRLGYLLGYPHGCIEQITSKVFPQLYLNKFSSLSHKQKSDVDAAIKEGILKLRSYLLPSGSFSYWPGNSSSSGWGSVYATHFLLAAEGQGYMVPANLKKSALGNLRQLSRRWKDSDDALMSRSEELTQAYRLYVLALAQSSEIGAMNRLKERSGLSPMSRWVLAAAYALVGREDVAKELIVTTQPFDTYTNRNEWNYTYGSLLRDQAFRLQTLILLKKNEEAAQLAKHISESMAGETWYSTQSTAFSLIALSGFFDQYASDNEMNFQYTVKQKSDKISSNAHIWTETLLTGAGASESVEVKNNGNSTLFVRFITEGIPNQGEEEAYQKDVYMDVKYMEAANNPVDIRQLEQGTNFTAVVNVKNPGHTLLQNLVLTQIFPAGWEILNTRFLEGGSDETAAGISYQDIRDDRVYSYIDELPAGRQVTIKINLCAVYPGKFYLPPVWCEAMYDHLIRTNTEGIQIEIK